ncbi:pre-peptidase C-terminal domain-containing protein [Candidatus Leptofilum sp.]|uniref:nSTAND1 domain-containing NTPase n=1 Tax=Candidatus Leptofilum sp. TaxID=3241576 RepID=UPI003B5BAC83
MSSQQPNLAHNNNPYVGPRSFARDQFNLFKGRSRETDELYSLLLARRLVLFYAQSGAGKTSLLNAGLIPQLEDSQEGFEVLPIGRVGDSVKPPNSVENIFVFNLLMSLGISKQPEKLVSLRLSQFLLDLIFDGRDFIYADERSSHFYPTEEDDEWNEEEAFTPVKPRVLIIDQFEEIFTVHPEYEQERIAFFHQLSKAMSEDPYLYILLSMRGDYVDRISPYVHLLPNSLRSRYNMERMRETAALQAVSLPAEEAGRPFAPEVAQKLVNYLRRVQSSTATIEKLDPYVETVQLQVVCMQLWQSLADVPGKNITMENVDQVAQQYVKQSRHGGVDSATVTNEDPLALFIDTALASYYEQAVTSILNDPTLPTIDEYQLRNWFSKELITEAGTRSLLPRGKTETEGVPETIVALLDTKHHLVRDDMRGGRPFIELVHDSFVDPILSANQKWQENLNRQTPWLNAAFLYKKTQDPALLLKDDSLKAAQQQAKTMQSLPDEANIYLNASQEAQEARETEQQAKQQQQQLEHERAIADEHRKQADLQQKRAEEAEAAKAKQGRLATTAVVFTVLAIVATIFAFSLRQQAIGAQATAEAAATQAIAAESTAVANATRASDEAIKAQEAANRAATAQAEAEAAQVEAQQQEYIADSLWLAAQAEEYLNNSQTVSAVLLGVVANQTITSAQFETTDNLSINSAKDFTQGILLEALFYLPQPDEAEMDQADTLFSRSVLVPTETISNLFPGPQAHTLATLQEGAIVYWSIDELITKTVELPTTKNTITQATIDQNSSRLAIAADKTVTVFPLTDGAIGESITIEAMTEQNEDPSISTMTFNANGTVLAIVACAEANEPASDAQEGAGTGSSQGDGNETAVCQIQIHNLSDGGPLTHACQLPLPNITAVAFFDYENHLVWSGQQNETSNSQLFILDYDICESKAVPVPTSHNIQSIALLPEVEGQSSLLVTSGGSFLQWWRFDKEQIQLHQLGSLLQTANRIRNGLFLPSQQAYLTLDDKNNIVWYEANLSSWPQIGCGLANRNFTQEEWENAFPLDSYEQTCKEYYDFGPHISLALNALDEAKISLQLCNLAEAEQDYIYASEIAQEADNEDILNIDFSSWALAELLSQHILDPSSCQLNDTDTLQALVESNIASDLIDIANIIARGKDFLDQELYSDALYEYETAFNQIATLLPEKYYDVFNHNIIFDYGLICALGDASDYDMACNRLVGFAKSLSIGTPIVSTTQAQQVWAFNGDVGDIFSISMNTTTDTLDPFLIIFDADGNFVDFNDNDGESFNSLVPTLILTSAEQYIILATRIDMSFGSYELEVTQGLPKNAFLGSTNSAHTDDTQLWVFEGQAGDFVTIAMNAVDEALDPYLTLLDSNSNWLIEDDDSGGNLNALIISFPLVETGQYYIQTTGLSGSVGGYELTITRGKPSEISLNTSEIANMEESQVWIFKAQAGDFVTIRMNEVDIGLDPYLTLLDSNNNLLMEDDDGGSNLNALIEDFPISESGQYYIRATGLGGSEGEYELTIETNPIPASLEQIEQGMVAEGLAQLQEIGVFDEPNRLTAIEYNEICWWGSLWGFAAEVLFACETAVSLDPTNGGIADSYAVALALLDRTEEALIYFRQFIEWEGGYNKTLREGWIEELEEGRNPFIVDGDINHNLLEILRNE